MVYMSDEESEYRASIPIYQFPTTGVVSTGDKESDAVDGSLPDSIKTIEDFDKLRYETSHMHLNSALFFADEAKRIEDFISNEQSTDEDQEESNLRIDARVPLANRHDIFVIYSVISTISFLEALVNEFYERHLRIANGNSTDGFTEELEKNKNISDPRFYDLLIELDAIENRDFEYESVIKKMNTCSLMLENKTSTMGENPTRVSPWLKLSEIISYTLKLNGLI